LNVAFDINRALECATLVQSAYAQFDGRANAIPAVYGEVAPLFVTEKGQKVILGFVATKDDAAYVVMRGTRSVLEWLDDAFVFPQPFFTFGNTTRGFFDLYAQLSPQICKALQSVHVKKTFITGHSLGAALVHLAALDIFQEWAEQTECYTFCGPRAGDPAFAQAFKDHELATWRIFNTEDVVPTVPMASPFPKLFGHAVGEFEHVGQPMAVTFNHGSLDANHNLDNLVEVLPTLKGFSS
jgi:triacylglycerol lipase